VKRSYLLLLILALLAAAAAIVWRFGGTSPMAFILVKACTLPLPRAGPIATRSQLCCARIRRHGLRSLPRIRCSVESTAAPRTFALSRKSMLEARYVGSTGGRSAKYVGQAILSESGSASRRATMTKR